METSYRKGFAVLPIILVIALLAIGGGVYYFVQKTKISQPTIVSQVVTTTPTPTSTVAVPQSNAGQILLGESAHYENLSPEEKLILQAYVKSWWAPDFLYPTMQDAINGTTLKYYDTKKIVAGVNNGKFYVAVLISRDGWKQIGVSDGLKQDVNFFPQLYIDSGYFESEDYVISVNGFRIYYYKAGDSDINLVPGSALSYPNPNEVYVSSSGGGLDDYDASFDKITKTLTVSVYKTGPGYVHQKVRTAKFVLP